MNPLQVKSWRGFFLCQIRHYKARSNPTTFAGKTQSIKIASYLAMMIA
jgi:hypothetical protein